MIEELRNKIVTEEFDYNFLVSCLSKYSNPRDKVTRLLRSGAIIRVKKGLYIFGPKYSFRPYSKEILANLIYGPSYISLEYALSYYQMIPERIETVTSITSKRDKYFKTPLANFLYRYVNISRYQIGIKNISLGNSKFLIATQEKALSDKVAQINTIKSNKEMKEYLFENLRISEDSIRELKISKLYSIAKKYNHQSVDLLFNIVKEI